MCLCGSDLASEREAGRGPSDLRVCMAAARIFAPSSSIAVCPPAPPFVHPQAYTSQFISLVMFGLMMSEDRISLQDRRREIILGLQSLPGMSQNATFLTFKSRRLFWAALFLTLSRVLLITPTPLLTAMCLQQLPPHGHN